MKKLLAAAAVLGALVVAAPASAEHRYDRGYDRAWSGINEYQRELEQRIWRGMRTGRLSEREAGRLRAEFGHIVHRERFYRRDGLSPWERRDLIRRLDRLDTLLMSELRDWNDYRG
ncbi:MAG TPA: hypothetical protein VJ748_05280 [Vitreimonas sp.]|jgi:hypothetical protein|nr:hypothetical protein [Vitreimonas sp.]